ncbi:MAG: hypothetical protein ACREGD_04705 [Candidatus Saccharimonadales bacterium]
MPYDVFLALARKICLATVELLPFRTNPDTGETEALLTQRPATDDFKWADKWHIPGTVVRAWSDTVPHDETIDFDAPDFNPDDTFGQVVNRLLKNELQGGVRLTDGPFLWGSRLRRGNRSLELTAMLHAGVEVVDPTQPLPAGQFFSVAELVEAQQKNFIVGHRWAIGKAAAAHAVAGL